MKQYHHPECVKIYFKENTRLEVLFSDGITKSFDCVNLINKYPQCSLLYNREFFLKGKNDVFAIIWNDDIDIDVEWIYEEGVEVENTDEYRLEALLGFKIKELRLSKEMSQKELSKLTGIDQGNISKKEIIKKSFSEHWPY